MTGEWVWSSEEESGNSSGDEAAAKDTLPLNAIKHESSDEDAAENDEYYQNQANAQQPAESNVPINLVLRLR